MADKNKDKDNDTTPSITMDTLPFSHPLYLHPSDTQGGAIIQQVLVGSENYSIWSKAMQIALKGKQKLGFVEGTCRKEDQEPHLRDHWERCNAIVLSWILNSVSKDLANGMVYFQNSHLLWEDLRERFHKVSSSRIFSLYREIHTLSQGSMTVAEYYTRLKDLWEEQSSIMAIPSCSCVTTQSYSKCLQEQKVIQFLMNLNGRHTHARGQILLMSPLPSLNQVYNMIHEDEAQKNIVQSLSNAPVHGLVTSSRGRGRTGRGRGRGGLILECDYCHRKGHTREFCYHLVGYPTELKGAKVSQEAKGLSVESEAANEGQPVTHKAGVISPSFTEEEYQTLLEMIRQNKEGPVLALTGKGLLSSLNPRKSQILWVIDSGATAHMLGDKSLLQSYSEYSGSIKNIKIPNGDLLPITHQGTVEISKSLTLRNVLYAPKLEFNLISVSQLTRESDCFATFYRDRCMLQDLRDGRMMATGRVVQGLYLMNLDHDSLSNVFDFNSVSACKEIHSTLLHYRMGHAPLSILKHLHSITGDIADFDGKCDVCFQSKQTKLSFPISVIKSVRCFELVHLDVWGPYKEPTHDGCQYFLTVVDDFSRATWIFLMRHKSEATSYIKYFIAHVGNQFPVSIKRLRTDNGTEFINQELRSYLADKGIIHERSCPYTPEQNGVVERKHRTLLQIARSLLIHSGIPIIYWGECIKFAVHVMNRTPSKILNYKTPYEIVYNILPSYDHLRVFGCLAYATDLNVKDKFGSRSFPCIFLGYPDHQKGFILLNINNNKIFVSRHVKFVEDKFPFKDSLGSDQGGVVQKPYDMFLYDVEPVMGSMYQSVSMPISNEQISPIVEQATQRNLSNAKGDTINKSLRPQRDKRPPIWASDYICNLISEKTKLGKDCHDNQGKCKYPIENYMTYSNISPSYLHFLAAIDSVVEPYSYKQAVKQNHWVEAMKNEMEALENNKTWDIVPLPRHKRAIGCKWVYKIKYRPNGEVEKYKARLVAKGYNQQEGIDYRETFSPVVKMATVRLVLKIASLYNWDLNQMDVHNAFLQGNLDEEIYMTIPEGLGNYDKNMVCRLKKSLYGLKQSSRQWNLKLTQSLVSGGFKQSYHDYSLFTKEINNEIVVVLVYVDDILVTGNSKEGINDVKKLLNEQFKIKDLGQMKYFLGIEIARSGKGIVLSQRKYVLDLLNDTGMSGCKPLSLPMLPSLRLQAYEEGKHKEEDLLKDAQRYRNLVGRLIYLTTTRPDISFPVQVLSQFMVTPMKSHMAAAYNVLRYLKQSPGKGILLSSRGSLELECWCDADWGACPSTRRSVTGYSLKLGGSTVFWKTKKQATVSRSSAEAEYRALASAVSEIIWFKGVLLDLRIEHMSPVNVFCDSKSAIYIATNPVFHERTKHLEIDLHFVREKLSQNLIKLIHVRTKEQEADIFTKAVSKDVQRKLLFKLGCIDLFSPQLEGEC